MLELDLLDRQILSALDRDGRASVAEIAKNLNVSRQLVNTRLKKLEAKDFILGTYTIFDSGVVGYNWYRALIRLLNITKRQKEELIDYLKQHPKVVWLGEVGGRWDIAVNFACESPESSLSITYLCPCYMGDDF